MIFQHTHELVMSGAKTQTRRLVAPRTIQPMFYDLKSGAATPTDTGESDGEWLYNDTVWHAKPCEMGKGLMGLNYTKAKPKYRVGSIYAVQPGRGKKSVGRIKVLRIRREDVRYIGDADVLAEGFNSRALFLLTWTLMHDEGRAANVCANAVAVESTHEAELILQELHERPAERYQAWVIEFELVSTQPALAERG